MAGLGLRTWNGWIFCKSGDVRWQIGQFGTKKLTSDGLTPSMERLKRIDNGRVTHGYSTTSRMSPKKWRTTNEHGAVNQDAYRMHSWQTEYPTDININWKYHYSIPFSCTSDTVLHWFQYRVQHRFLPLNRYLKRIGIGDNEKCNICKTMEETIEHLFCLCEDVLTLWGSLSLLILNKTNLNFHFDTKTILFGGVNSLPSSPINLIILLTKYYIYWTSRKQIQLYIIHLHKYLTNRYFIEKYIASKNMQSEKFNNTWNQWCQFFSD